MPTPGQIVITIRKEVPTQQAGQAVWLLVKTRIADQPDLKATAHFTSSLIEDPSP